jgi:hypothetical protein
VGRRAGASAWEGQAQPGLPWKDGALLNLSLRGRQPCATLIFELEESKFLVGGTQSGHFVMTASGN